MATDNQKRSRLQERRLADSLQGRTQKGSGSGPSLSQKGDVRVVGQIRAEAKTTEKRSYSLKLDDWRKVQAQAIQGGLEEPVMQIQFERPNGQNTKLAVIDWHRYEQLRAAERKADPPQERTWGYDG